MSLGKGIKSGVFWWDSGVAISYCIATKNADFSQHCLKLAKYKHFNLQKIKVFFHPLNWKKKQILLKLSRFVANSDIHFNLDNKEYLFTIIRKRRKNNSKKAKVCYVYQHFRFLSALI